MATGSINKMAIKTTTASGSATIAANANGAISYTVPAMPGYTCVGVVGVQNSHGANFAITDFDFTQNRVVLRNLASSSATVTVVVLLLYISNSLS